MQEVRKKKQVKNTYVEWLNCFNVGKVLYLHAPIGYGKRAAATEFAKAHFDNYYFFSAKDVELSNNVKAEFEKCKDESGRKIFIITDVKGRTEKQIDEVQFDYPSTDTFYKHGINVMLIGNAPSPKWLSTLKLSDKVAIESRTSLELNIEQIAYKMKEYEEFSKMNNSELIKHANRCYEFSHGYPASAVLFLQRLREDIYTPNAAERFAQNDMNDYFDILTKDMSANNRELLLRLSVFDTFTLPMAREIGAVSSGEDLAYLLDNGYLEMHGPSEYAFEHNFHRYLQGEMIKTNLFDAKELLNKAGQLFEAERNMNSALKCYHLARAEEKLEDLIIYLSENADGCEFAEMCDRYMGELLVSREENNPRLLGAKALIEAYSLRRSGYDMYLDRLKTLADKKGAEGRLAHDIYIRTLIACPIGNSDRLKDSLFLFVDYLAKNAMKLNFIMPTGNMPSIINGGLDLIAWANLNPPMQEMLGRVINAVMGYEAVGTYNTTMGEIFYERNQKSKAVERIAKGLDEASRKGSIRVRYAATGIMARILCSEKNSQKARAVLEDLYREIKAQNYNEILPNIAANIVNIALMENDMSICDDWFEKHAPNEYEKFYITKRYILFTKAKVYVALGKELEALHIISMLEEYAEIAERKYFKIQLNILKAIILYRMGEPFEAYLVNATKSAYEYGFIRVLADEGAALLPLFKKVNWKAYKLSDEYISAVTAEMEGMAKGYACYLNNNTKGIKLTKKETEVLEFVAHGNTNEQIANGLGITLGTVKFHVSNIMKKLGANNRVLAVTIAREEGII